MSRIFEKLVEKLVEKPEEMELFLKKYRHPNWLGKQGVYKKQEVNK